MDFYIRKNSTGPYIVMKVIFDNETDYKLINDKIGNAAVTFSMVNIETGKFKIANRAGKIYSREKTIKSPYNPYEHFIYYKWREKDTNEPGVFKGEFRLNFIETCKVIALPIKDELIIYIKDSITKTTLK